VFGQALNDFLKGSALEPILLGFAPSVRSSRSAAGGRGSQVLADMKKIARESSLLPEHFTRLQANPLGSIAQRVNVAV
jgi:hypothetical protein